MNFVHLRFSSLYTTLPHDIIKEKLLDVIERIIKNKFKKEGKLYLACNDNKAFCTSTDHKGYIRGSFKKFPDCFHYLNVSCPIKQKLYVEKDEYSPY